MSHSRPDRVGAVTDDLHDRGYTLTREEGAVVSDGPGGLTSADAPLAVTSLVDGNPLTVVSAVATAAHRGFVPVLVTDGSPAAVEALLSEPFLLRGREAGREFVSVEDRIRLPDDSYACVGTRGEFRWAESPSGPTDDPRLVLTVGDEVCAVFDSVDGLTCPGPSASAFRYSYARGADGRFRVLEDGAAVGAYTGVSAMRADGFRPVPLPLVPEHHVRANGRLARSTVVASVEAGTVTYCSFP